MSKYTKLKVFHYQNKLDNLKTDKILSPIHIRLKPTNVCNHRCSYCAYRQPDLQLGQDMVLRDYIPKDKMLEIVKDLKDMKVKAVTFSGGGEPLCYPHIMEALEGLKDANIKIGVLTNGALLKGDVADFLAKNALWVRVSMDGWDDDSYKQFRGIPDYNRIIDNMKSFKKIGGSCVLGVSIIVTKDNADHVYDMISGLVDVGVDSIKISPVVISNVGSENNTYHEPFYESVRKQVAQAKYDYKEKVEIFDAYHDQEESFAKNYDWCPMLQLLCVIGADLNIYPCQDKAYNLENGVLGSIKDQSFKDFWFSDKKNFFKINPCVHCNNHCVADSKNKMIIEYLEAEHTEFV